ncbi:MAG: YciI family protein [Pseudomonadota bacterium]
MHFVFYGTDKVGQLELRKQTRAAHLDWIKANAIVLAGPRLDESGDMIGSMVVLEADDLTEAQKIFASDPYAQAGLFASSEITAWNWVVGAPAGAAG